MELEWIRRILLRDLDTVRRDIAAFPTDESVWVAPAGITNAAGTLALHLAGNLQHFIGAVLGGSGYVRTRDVEFSARGLSRAALIEELDRAGAAIESTLGPGRTIDLSAPYPETVGGAFQVITGDWLVHLASHLAFHMGQMGYLRRVVTGDSTSMNGVGIAGLATAVKVPKA